MQLTEQQLLNIIFEEITLMENFLKPHRGETVPLDDKVIKAILALTSKKKLNEEMLTEDVKEKIRNLVVKAGDNAEAVVRVAKRLAIPAALVASIWGGGMTGAYLAGGGDSAANQDNIELQVQDDDAFRVQDIAGTYYDQEQFSGMSNQEKIDNAWSNYDISAGGLDKAPVSSTVWIYKYKMIPADQIGTDTPLPLMGTTAGTYYKFLKDRVEANPMVELPLLKNLVYGDVGKWAGGVGGKGNFKVAEDGSQILPPDWTVAYTVYADLMEEKTISLMDYHIDNPEGRGELYQALGVQDEAGFNKFIQDTMYKIGRPLQTR